MIIYQIADDFIKKLNFERILKSLTKIKMKVSSNIVYWTFILIEKM